MANMDVRLAAAQIQSQKQIMTQRMSQVQIMSLNLLSMSDTELRTAVYEKAGKNPALVIVSDGYAEGVKNASVSSRFSDNTHYASVSEAGKLASDNFQSVLESYSDSRRSLRSHLMEQCNIASLSARQRRICEALIDNLDSKGFHILSPYSLLNNEDDTPELLEQCINIVQHFDPIGTCCKNFEESLFVQAKINGDAGECAMFILDGHFAVLDPPVTLKVLKKINSFIEQQNKMSFVSENVRKTPFSESDVEEAISYIKTLNPFPASEYDNDEVNFISSDVVVKKVSLEDKEVDEIDSSLISYDKKHYFKIELLKGSVPELKISKQYQQVADINAESGKTDEASEKIRAEHDFAVNAINDAKSFIDGIANRQSTVKKAVTEIVKFQNLFFSKGPGYLKPLKQKDIANIVSLHEGTISRMANGKYLECEWGVFPIKYFFTNAVSSKSTEADDVSSDKGIVNSKESVKHAVEQILTEHKDDKKPLSDQKISDILAQKGINVARRTVAKYRGELNINSSYGR